MKKQLLFEDQVSFGVSDVNDGKMRFFGGDEQEIIANQTKLGELIELNGEAVARVRTTYDTRSEYTDYREITEENLKEYSILNSEKDIPVTDGLVTKCKNVGILLPLADCLGAVVFDEKQKIIGILHAGRHNIEQNGPYKYIQFLKENYGSRPEDLKIYCSPYAMSYHITALNMTMEEAAMEQFKKAGILPENIIDEQIDVAKNDNYPSNSSGDLDKRFAIVVKQM